MATRLGFVGAVRLIVGCLGLAGFVAGVVVAWRSSSSTTLLIVSAILLVLAALGLDWDEIRGTGPGGWTVQLLRGVGERLGQVAAGEDVPPAVREELEALRAEVKALTPPPRRRRPSPGAADWRATFEELFKTKATHAFPQTGSVELVLRTPSQSDSRFRATVKTPTGRAFNAVTRRPITPLAGAPANTYKFTYPDDFEGSEPLVPGRYEVEWRSAPLVDPLEVRTPAIQLALSLRAALATDSFTIPEGGEWQRDEPSAPGGAAEGPDDPSSESKR